MSLDGISSDFGVVKLTEVLSENKNTEISDKAERTKYQIIADLILEFGLTLGAYEKVTSAINEKLETYTGNKFLKRNEITNALKESDQFNEYILMLNWQLKNLSDEVIKNSKIWIVNNSVNKLMRSCPVPNSDYWIIVLKGMQSYFSQKQSELLLTLTTEENT